MRIKTGHINFQPTLNFEKKISVDNNNCFSRKYMWVIYMVSVLLLMEGDYLILCKVLVRCLHEDLWNDSRSWTCNNPILTSN